MAVPLLLQGALIVTYIRKLPIQRLFIKIWAGLVFMAGAAGLVSSCARMLSNSLTEGALLTDRIILGDVLLKLVCTVVGVYYYVMLPKSTKIIPNNIDIKSNSQEAA